MHSLAFPPDFKFGAATAAYQVEGNIENDWSVWERLGKLKDPKARNGRGCEHWERFYDDIPLIQNLGVSMYRMSLEWARLEPKPGQFDETASRGYRDRIQALVAAGIRPVITLHHYTHPQWFHDETPWHSPLSLKSWERYVNHCTEILKGIDCAIITFNEPNVLLLGGYLTGMIPPGIADGKRAFQMSANLMRAHAIASQIFRGLGIKDIGISQNILSFNADRFWHPIDQALTRLAEQGYNHAFLKALTTGTLEFSFPGLMSGKEKIEGAANSMTFTGINYYTRAHLRFILKPPFLEFRYRDPQKRGLTDIGWELYPEGFGNILGQMKLYGLPVWVTENGIDDRSGTRRNEYLYNHLHEILKAIDLGVPITTYLHWSLMDNFEWLEAWGPRFGLYHVNFETMERTATPTVKYFKDITTQRMLLPVPA